MLTNQNNNQGIDNQVMIGLPGTPPITQFQYNNNLAFINVQNPGNIAQIYVALTNPLPSNQMGIGIFYSAPPFEHLRFMGVLANEKPSEILTTNWGFQKELFESGEIKLVLRLDNLESFRELYQISLNENRKVFYFFK